MATRSSRTARDIHADDTAPIAVQPKRKSRPTTTARAVPRVTYGFPIVVALVHSIIVQIAAFVAQRYGEARDPSPPFGTMPPEMEGLAHYLVEPLRQWDGLWYRLIALEGYDFHAANAAFWPLFPMSMRALSRATGLSLSLSGYLIANVSFVIALILLYRLVTLDFNHQIARRTLWAVALFPTAFFFSAVYTEAPFLMLSVAAILSARLGRWWLAGALGVLAALTRSYGVFLIAPFAVLYFRQYGFYLRELFPRVIAVGMPALGPLIFGWHLERVQGSWRAFINVQSMWNRTSAMPWTTMRCAIDGCVLELTQYGQTRDWNVQGADWGWIDQLRADPSWSLITSTAFRNRVGDSDTLELVVTLLLMALLLIGFKFLPLYQIAYTVPALVIPLFSPSTVHPLMSMPRFALTMFPLFIVIAILLRRRWLAIPVAALSATLLFLLTMQFANWYWVS
jgi:hypothetical protein